MRKFFALVPLVAVAFGGASTFAADKPKPDPEAAFKKMDKDSDGSLTEAELVGKKEGEMADKAKKLFAKLDANKDGKLSLEEFKARGKKAK
jgi:Ca2+-binding EF-hand superfamily protein